MNDEHRNIIKKKKRIVDAILKNFIPTQLVNIVLEYTYKNMFAGNCHYVFNNFFGNDEKLVGTIVHNNRIYKLNITNNLFTLFIYCVTKKRLIYATILEYGFDVEQSFLMKPKFDINENNIHVENMFSEEVFIACNMKKQIFVFDTDSGKLRRCLDFMAKGVLIDKNDKNIVVGNVDEFQNKMFCDKIKFITIIDKDNIETNRNCVAIVDNKNRNIIIINAENGFIRGTFWLEYKGLKEAVFDQDRIFIPLSDTSIFHCSVFNDKPNNRQYRIDFSSKPVCFSAYNEYIYAMVGKSVYYNFYGNRRMNLSDTTTNVFEIVGKRTVTRHINTTIFVKQDTMCFENDESCNCFIKSRIHPIKCPSIKNWNIFDDETKLIEVNNASSPPANKIIKNMINAYNKRDNMNIMKQTFRGKNQNVTMSKKLKELEIELFTNTTTIGIDNYCMFVRNDNDLLMII